MGQKRPRQTGAMSFSGPGLNQIYQQLFECYGPQYWWPGDSTLEIMVGAVLTQNTAWSNVERAIDNLKSAGLLDPQAILLEGRDTLAALLRPAGYFNVKAKRLCALCEFLLENPELDQLADRELRERFLRVHGIGPETADDILLYAFKRPVFVIDAYTRRLFGRLGLVDGKSAYETLRRNFEQALDADAGLFNEYHALIVHHAKLVCRTRPDCENCCLRSLCEHAANPS